MSTVATAPSPYAAMLRGAVVPASVVSAAGVAVAGLVQGGPGLAGAGIAAAVVIGSGLLTLGAMRVARDAPPQALMGMALMTYFTKVIVLGALLVGIPDDGRVSRVALAACTVAALVAWTGGMIRTFQRLRLPVFGEA